MTTGEDAAQDQRERFALAHDGPVHLVENVTSETPTWFAMSIIFVGVVPSFTAPRYR